MKRIFKTFGAFALIALVSLSVTSCKTPSKNLIYADYTAFGDNLKANYQVDTRRCKGKDVYTIFDKENPMATGDIGKMMIDIQRIDQQNNTAGIYAMDKALDRIKYVQKKIFRKDPNTKYYVIYMTDGLDNISVQVAKNERRKNYKTPEKYKQKMRKKINKVSRCNKREKNDFNIYPIVFTGTDLGDMRESNGMTKEDFDSYLKRNENMGWLRGSSKGISNAPEINADADFNIIFESFEDAFRASSFEFAVPKGYVNKKIKMELCGTAGSDTANVHNAYFTAVLKNKGKKYYLTNIKLYDGLRFGEKEIEGKKFRLYATNNRDKKGTLSTFVLDRPQIKIEGIGDPVSFFVLQAAKGSENKVRQFTAEYDPKNPDNNKDLWIRNSEYDSQLKSIADAYIQLVIDCSLSLGEEQFKEEISTAQRIIAFIREMATGAEEKINSNK